MNAVPPPRSALTFAKAAAAAGLRTSTLRNWLDRRQTMPAMMARLGYGKGKAVSFTILDIFRLAIVGELVSVAALKVPEASAFAEVFTADAPPDVTTLNLPQLYAGRAVLLWRGEGADWHWRPLPGTWPDDLGRAYTVVDLGRIAAAVTRRMHEEAGLPVGEAARVGAP